MRCWRMTDDARLRVGWVGVGNLGGVMLRCVIDDGFPVTVYDLRRAAVEAFVAQAPGQVRAVASASEVAASSDVVCIVVNTDEQVLDVTLGENGLFAGRGPNRTADAETGCVVATHATVAHSTLRQVADGAPEGVHVLDAGVAGTRGVFSVGDLAVMVGGDAVAFERAKPVFDSFGGLVLHLGPMGRGMDAKLARNLAFYLWCMAALEAVSLFEAAGGSRATLLAVFEHLSMGMVGGVAGMPAPISQSDGAGVEQREAFAALARKDLKAALERAVELQLELPATATGYTEIDAIYGLKGLGLR